MSWVRKPTGFEMIRRAAAMVDEVYRDYRNRGLRAEHAREQTAIRFEISQRRVRSFLDGDVGNLLEEHWQNLCRKFLTHLDDEAEHAMRRASQRTATRTRLELERKKLAEIRRGVDVFVESNLPDGGCGDSDVVAVSMDCLRPAQGRGGVNDNGRPRAEKSG